MEERLFNDDLIPFSVVYIIEGVYLCQTCQNKVPDALLIRYYKDHKWQKDYCDYEDLAKKIYDYNSLCILVNPNKWDVKKYCLLMAVNNLSNYDLQNFNENQIENSDEAKKKFLEYADKYDIVKN